MAEMSGRQDSADVNVLSIFGFSDGKDVAEDVCLLKIK